MDYGSLDYGNCKDLTLNFMKPSRYTWNLTLNGYPWTIKLGDKAAFASFGQALTYSNWELEEINYDLLRAGRGLRVDYQGRATVNFMYVPGLRTRSGSDPSQAWVFYATDIPVVSWAVGVLWVYQPSTPDVTNKMNEIVPGSKQTNRVGVYGTIPFGQEVKVTGELNTYPGLEDSLSYQVVVEATGALPGTNVRLKYRNTGKNAIPTGSLASVVADPNTTRLDASATCYLAPEITLTGTLVRKTDERDFLGSFRTDERQYKAELNFVKLGALHDVHFAARKVYRDTTWALGPFAWGSETKSEDFHSVFADGNLDLGSSVLYATVRIQPYTYRPAIDKDYAYLVRWVNFASEKLITTVEYTTDGYMSPWKSLASDDDVDVWHDLGAFDGDSRLTLKADYAINQSSSLGVRYLKPGKPEKNPVFYCVYVRRF